jgi:hypothetical protein
MLLTRSTAIRIAIYYSSYRVNIASQRTFIRFNKQPVSEPKVHARSHDILMIGM